jgi:hypothetical protein
MHSMSLLLTVALLAFTGCYTGSSSSQEERRPQYQVVTDGLAPTYPEVNPPAPCQSVVQCQTVADTCGGCTCRAVGSGSPNPSCSSTHSYCFRDPCAGYIAVESNGGCVLIACGGSGGPGEFE